MSPFETKVEQILKPYIGVINGSPGLQRLMAEHYIDLGDLRTIREAELATAVVKAYLLGGRDQFERTRHLTL